MARKTRRDDHQPRAQDASAPQGEPLPASGKPGTDPLKALEKERDKLQTAFDGLNARSRKEMGDLGFWGVVGGIGLAADMMFMGGLGTAIAAWSMGEYFMYARRARDVGNDLQKVKTRIHDMQQARFEMELQKMKDAPQNTPSNDRSLQAEFSPAAQAEIKELRDKLSQLQSQIGQMQEEKEQGLNKPKFKKPSGGDHKPGNA